MKLLKRLPSFSPEDPWITRGRPDLRGLEWALSQFLGSDRRLPAKSTSPLPRISIITPSLNQAEYLRSTIRSVLNQGYPSLEYIVVDGGSTDGSVEILHEYGSRLTRWISDPDAGQADAINKGLRLATGEWIAFQNSDDVYLPGALRAMAAMFADPSIDIITGHLLYMDAGARIVDTHLVVPPRLAFHASSGIQLHNQTAFWRRDLLERAGEMDGRYNFSFDYDFFFRLLRASRGTGLIQRYTGAFRQHCNAKSSTIAERGRREHGEIRKLCAPRVARIATPVLQLAYRAYKAYHCATAGNAWYLERLITT